MSRYIFKGIKMDKIKGRLSEPSTWAGLAALLEGLKFALPQYAALLIGLQAIFGGVAVVAREAASKPVGS